MKKHFYLLLTIGSAISSQATTYNYNSGTLDTVIPDNNLNGVVFNGTISGNSKITDVKVGLNITGGYNGDLFGYLVHSSGYAVLLDRVGRGTTGDLSSYGYTTGGMNVYLHDSASLNIHSVMNPASGAEYVADGRNVIPFAGPDSAFNPPPSSTAPLASFNDLNPNGAWTLFFSDVSAGGVSTLHSWSLEITAVPEPVTVALGIFGGLFGITQGVRYIRRRASAAQ